MKECICLASVCLLMLFASGASLAQQPSASPTVRAAIGTGPPCPVIVVSSSKYIEVGKPLEFKVVMSSPKPAEPTYTWEVVGGVIAEGQGTDKIKVNVARIPGPTITATVSVGGLDAVCAKTASSSNSNSAIVIHEPCPVISVSCPSDVEVGKPLEFKSTFNPDVGNAKPTYKWEVVGGEIAEGQGTPTLLVNKTTPPGKGVTATLHVGGFDPMCSTIASCSTATYHVPPAEKFDSYISVPLNNEKPLLNLFAAALKQRPGDQGYILGYGGHRSRSHAAQKAVDRAKAYLVQLGMDETRVVTVKAGLKKEPTVELWLVPMGAIPPVAEPEVDPAENKPN